MLYELRDSEGRPVADPFLRPDKYTDLSDEELRQQYRIYPSSRQATEQQLFVARRKAIKKLKKQRDAKQNGTVVVNVGGADHSFQIDQRSRDLLTGAIAGFSAGIPFPDDFRWTSTDNVDVSMSYKELLSLGAAVTSTINSAHVKYRELRAQIESAVKLEHIASILRSE